MKDRSSTLRVGVVGLRGIPASYGGVETAVQETSVRLVLSGHSVTVYCMRSANPLRPSKYMGVNLVYIPTLRATGFGMLLYSILACVHALFQRYDVVHLHGLGAANLAPLFRLFGQRVVVTCHGLDYLREKWGMLARAYLRMGEFTGCRTANAFITVSKSLSSYFSKTHGVRAIYIPNGVAVPRPLPTDEPIAPWQLVPGQYILFVGRLVECKRVDLLISAFLASEVDLDLTIVGTGPAHIVDDLHVRAASNPRIHFTGALYGDDLNRLFSNAAFFVLPSVLEGLPIALIEALSYDLPLVVSDLPENLEVVTDTDGVVYAEVCKQNDVLSTSSAISRAALAVPRNSDGTLRDFVAAKYNWDATVSELLSVYRSL